MRALVDAVCIRVLCKETIVVAIGNQLILVYLTPNGTTRQTFATLPRLVDKINGIEKCIISDDEYLIAFHAGREAYSIILNCKTHEFSECSRIVIPEEICLQPVPYIHRRANDWISSMSLLSASELGIVTSHGVALLLKRNQECENQSWNLVEKCCCEDGSTLYCSTLSGRKWEKVLCFSGTANGLLLVWRVSGSTGGRGSVLNSIMAHKGVIFSIAVDIDNGLLTTTSDDRSVKFWTIDLKQANYSTTVSLREERYCFAHTARVFQCRIIGNANRMLVASIGEDAHLCLWNTEGDLLIKKRLDDGPTLWCLDYDEETSTIFTTASNGNLHKYCIQHWLEDKSGHTSYGQSAMVDISPELSLNEHLAKVRFSYNGSIIAVSNQNRVLMLDTNGSSVYTVDMLDQFKCSIIEVGGDLLYLAGGSCVYIFEITSKGFTSISTNQHISFVNIDGHEDGEEQAKTNTIRSLNFCGRSNTLAVCDANGHCLVYNDKLTVLLSNHRIPKSAERWLTAFAAIDNQFLLMADRSGHLYLFERKLADPVFKLANVHGKLGITSISIVKSEQDLGYMLETTGHDSRVCELFVDLVDKKIVALVSAKIIVSWIDRTFSLGRRRLYLGFNDKHFIMADNHNEVCIQFDCGGGHRCWDYYYDELSDAFTYVFIQQKKLKKMVYTPQQHVGSALCLPRYDWHTRACNVLQVVQQGDSYLIVSGGEDNILRMNTYRSGEFLDMPRKHVFGHISSIKTIAIKEFPEQSRLVLISAGGRAQICVTSIDTKNFLVKQECEYMLCVSDSERNRWKMNRQSNFDPETKFMCAAFLRHQDSIAFGCSDGCVRTFNLKCTDGRCSLELASEASYERCILNVVSVVMHDKSILITMATDGFVCFWELSNFAEPFFRHKLHSSGINSVDLMHTSSQKLLLATGGDDQSITVSLFKVTSVNEKLQVEVMYSLCEEYLHTAQVTGIKFIDFDKIISVGVDQRIYLTTFTGFSKLNTISTLTTCVADVKGLSFIQENGGIIVYGCGIEFLSLDDMQRTEPIRKR